MQIELGFGEIDLIQDLAAFAILHANGEFRKDWLVSLIDYLETERGRNVRRICQTCRHLCEEDESCAQGHSVVEDVSCPDWIYEAHSTRRFQ